MTKEKKIKVQNSIRIQDSPLISRKKIILWIIIVCSLCRIIMWESQFFYEALNPFIYTLIIINNDLLLKNYKQKKL